MRVVGRSSSCPFSANAHTTGRRRKSRGIRGSASTHRRPASLSRFGVRLRYPVPRDGAVRTGPDSRTKVAPSRRTTLKVRITVGNARGYSQGQLARGMTTWLVTQCNRRQYHQVDWLRLVPVGHDLSGFRTIRVSAGVTLSRTAQRRFPTLGAVSVGDGCGLFSPCSSRGGHRHCGRIHSGGSGLE